MLNWLLIFSITLVSTAMLIFFTAYEAILHEAGAYYQKDRSLVILLFNCFPIMYLLITPCIFWILKKKYCLLVIISVILNGIGCVGRDFCKRDYTLAIIFSFVVAVGHIPIITAPYGLLSLFPENQKQYASVIPLFVPNIGMNFCIFYGMHYISSED